MVKINMKKYKKLIMILTGVVLITSLSLNVFLAISYNNIKTDTAKENMEEEDLEPTKTPTTENSIKEPEIVMPETTEPEISQPETNNEPIEIPAEEPSQNEFIRVTDFSLENNGGTFRVGDKLVFHLTIESQYELANISIVFQSTVNNAALSTYAAPEITKSDNGYIVTLTREISEDFIPGLWEGSSINIWDKYNTLVSVYDYDFSFTVTT